jgi:hypothetical protein
MRTLLSIIAFGLCTLLPVKAQIPTAKVDINMAGRSLTEVNQPGYTAWYIATVHSATLDVAGVHFNLVATGPTPTSAFRTSWSKALVQTPYFTRLANDGVKVDNDSLLAHPGIPASMELHISGLPVGKHTFQSYHNIWEDTTKINHCPMNLYLNGNLLFSKVRRSVMVKKNTDATLLLYELNVTEAGQEMVIRMEADTNFTASPGKTKDLNVILNGFELNTDDASSQAREPMPDDMDWHADADSGFYNLSWKANINNTAKTHSLYFGTDSVAVANATTATSGIFKGTFPLETTTFKVDGLYNLNNYYWRVDETDSVGLTTKGRIWRFKPRHLAFRGAEGYGRYAMGGRGGKVVYVTNLNPTGPGSFYDAVMQNTGPRTILFNVSGYITLDGRLSCNPNITIAGQTAPGKGICFRAAPIGINGETIARYIRNRLGAGITYDGIGMAGANFSILDHASISWTIDESFSSRGGKNFTLQRTLISEALNVAGHDKYPAGTAHGYAGSIGGDIGSFHHNLLAHNEGRNWSMAGGLDGNGYYSGRLDIFNMVVYNWGGRATDGGAMEVNFVNNYYKKGAATRQNYILKADLEGTGKGSQSYYCVGNVVENTNGTFASDGTDNSTVRTYTLTNGQVLNWTVFVDKPFFPSLATIQPAKEAYKSVLSDVGCNLPLFDNHDKRIVNETKNGTYTYSGSITGKPGLIDHQNDQGGYEIYPSEARAADFDTDLDGLPNWWELQYGSNPNSASGDFSDSNADPDKDGYTALEDYLEWMAVPHRFVASYATDTLSLSNFGFGYKNPTYSIQPNAKFNVQFTNGSALITPTTNDKGISYLDINLTDSEGSKAVQRIGLCVGAGMPEAVQSHTVDKSVDCVLYPTVFDKQVHFLLQSLQNRRITVSLCDLSGKQLQSRNFTVEPGANDLVFDCNNTLPSQLYLFRVADQKTKTVLSTLKATKH